MLRKNFRQQKLRYIRNIGSSSDVSPSDGRIGDPAKRSGNLRNALLGIVGRDVMSHRVLAAPLGHNGELWGESRFAASGLQCPLHVEAV